MDTITHRYHASIYIWVIVITGFWFLGGKAGIAGGVVFFIILMPFTWLVRKRSLITLNESELSVQKFMSNVSIPLDQISMIEHQKSIFGSYGIIRVSTNSSRSVTIKRVPMVAEFTAEIKNRMKKK